VNNIQIESLLQGMVKYGASDLHIKVGSPPGYRINGEIQPVKNVQPITPADAIALARQVVPEEQYQEFEKTGDIDFAHSVAGLSRFRVNVMRQRGTVAMVMRIIPYNIPDIESMGLPPICKQLVMKPRGLVLVTGPTGSGKSTTLAAMINYRNENSRGHIVTMEDPIEFIHRDKMSFVNQREIGVDTKNFGTALKRALRQDPNVILVGEMRDFETIALGITAAETGHLVLGTLHTTGAIQTIDRIVDVFPPDQQQQIRVQLAETIQGVISQTLLPKRGGGRIAAFEIMVGIDPIKNCIREGKTTQMQNFLQTGSKHGMMLLDASLLELVKGGQTEPEMAVAKAQNPEMLQKSIKGLTVRQMAPV
jgi:twitching motility protein PilT